jgi:heterodisulfide reductase subunit B
MRYAFFIGCVAKDMYPSIEASARHVFKRLGIELVDKRFSCCPAPGVIGSYHPDTWLVLGARNLCLAEEEGVDILLICSGCYGTLHGVWEQLKDERKKEWVNQHLKKIGFEYKGVSKPIHFLDVLDGIRDEIAAQRKMDLDLRVAVHYGCHYLKPSDGRNVKVEAPENLDEIVSILGCESVDFRDKLTCCGAGGGVWSGSEALALSIMEEKVRWMKEAGAECLVNICPFCHAHFDQGQKKVGGLDLPVLHLLQLLGLAFGIKDKRLGLHYHLVSPRGILKKVRRL